MYSQTIQLHAQRLYSLREFHMNFNWCNRMKYCKVIVLLILMSFISNSFALETEWTYVSEYNSSLKFLLNTEDDNYLMIVVGVSRIK